VPLHSINPKGANFADRQKIMSDVSSIKLQGQTFPAGCIDFISLYPAYFGFARRHADYGGA